MINLKKIILKMLHNQKITFEEMKGKKERFSKRIAEVWIYNRSMALLVGYILEWNSEKKILGRSWFVYIQQCWHFLINSIIVNNENIWAQIYGGGGKLLTTRLGFYSFVIVKTINILDWLKPLQVKVDYFPVWRCLWYY